MKLKSLLWIILALALVMVAPVAAQSDTDGMDDEACEFDVSAAIELLEDAQNIAMDGDIEAALEALDAAMTEIEAVQDACGPTELTLETPEGSVASLLTVLFSGEFEELEGLVCSDLAADLPDLLTELEASGAAEVFALAEISIDEVTYEVEMQDDTTATVNLGGSIIITVVGETQELAAEDFFGGPVTVVLEDDEWKLCDNALGGF